ncbi:hypothetical protein LXL04_002250 [Taraxacum kok-saghyz]
MLTLPPYSTPSHGDGLITINFRFGFDPKTDDYKVVKLFGIGQQSSTDDVFGFPLYTTNKWLQVEVYSMRTGSWELTSQTLPSHITNVIDGDYLCSGGHDGHLHWIGYVGDKKTYSEAIVAFNLGSNTFTHEIPLPLSMYGCQKSLRVFGGKLYVMSYEDDVCEVWVMDEYGVVAGPCQRFVRFEVAAESIDASVINGGEGDDDNEGEEGHHGTCENLHFGSSTHPSEFTSDNGFLIKYAYACFALYDPIASEVKILENYFPREEHVVVSKVVEYVDSLVWNHQFSSRFTSICIQQGGTSASISVKVGKSELKQMVKQMTFTGSEESPSDNFLASNDTSGFQKTLMASRSRTTTIQNLPDMILSNIFIRLFAKQLAQMRSISKSWNTLLSEPTFIKFHLHHSIYNIHQTPLHFCDDKSLHVVQLLANPHLQLTNCIKLPVHPKSQSSSLHVIGSVNGLICSSYSDSIIHIWNPSLSAVLTLPAYSMPPCWIDSEANNWLKVFFRFGYDPNTDDYKLVKLTGFADVDSSLVLWWMDVEIYSMRKGSWELINERFPSYIEWIDDLEVVCADGLEGNMHWIGSTDQELETKTIVAFDLGSETFREIPLPDSTTFYEHCLSVSLGVLAGKLCVMSWSCSGSVDIGCEVWVMEEYGAAESWAKRHVFSRFFGDIYPFGFISGNKFLIQDEYRLVMYDPVTEEAQILTDDCSYEVYHAGKIVEYVDSLVWVAPRKAPYGQKR